MADFTNEEFWFLVREDDRALPPDAANGVVIPPIKFSPLFLSPYFKAFITSNTAKPTWNFGGWFYLYSGAINNFVPLYVTRRGCLLDEWALLEFPLLSGTNGVSSSWHMDIQVPYWFKSMSFEIYQYYDGN